MISRIYAILSRILALFQRNRRERDLDDELRFHLEMETREQMRTGVPLADAAAAARRNFGGIDQVKEAYREQRSMPVIEVILQDLRYGVRMILRTPLLYALLLLIFALGIGVNTAVFSIVDAVLWRPLPFPHSENLVRIWYTDGKTGQRFLEASYPEVAALREKLRTVAQIAAFSQAPRILNDTSGEPVHVAVGRLSDDISTVLDEAGAAGRGFTENEIQSGERVVVLSHRLWQSRYAGGSGVIGQPIRIDNETYRVIGVAGRHAFPADVDLWRPLSRAEWEDDDREFQIIARLKPGITAGNLTALIAPAAWAQSMQSMLVRDVQTPLLLQLGAVGLVLLIACVNVANLLLAQGWRREKEIAIRAALGASRGRIVRQLLTETMLLSVAGGALGILIGRWSLELIRRINPGNIPRLAEAVVDDRVFAAMALLTALSGIGAALFPAIQLGRPASRPMLRTSDRIRRSANAGFRQGLVVLQISLATLLLITAGLVLKSFSRLLTLDRGYETRHVLAVPLTLRTSGVTNPGNITAFYDDVLRRVGALPGVQRIALGMKTPVDAVGLRVSFSSNSGDAPFQPAPVKALLSIITPGYFSTVGIAMQSGRPFEAVDRKGAQSVAIVNQTFARTVFRGAEAVGRSLRTQATDGDLLIVGVAGDATPSANTPQGPAIYVPFHQLRTPDMILLVRTSGDPSSLVSDIRASIWSVNPSVPLDNIRTLDDQLAAAAALPRFHTLLLGLFAALAITLASLGIYGIIADWVGEREHEIGVRRALGAEESAVMWMVLKSGLRLTICGVLFGVLAALWLEHLAVSVLFQVSPNDPLTFVTVVLAVLAVAVAAAAIPAFRASRIDPARSLRFG